jgi:hypothetical protein
MWRSGLVGYKGSYKKSMRAMEHVYIYGYVSFALGMLFLLGLVGFTYMGGPS